MSAKLERRAQSAPPAISDKDFIRIWQTSESARQVEQKTGLTRQAVNSRLHNLRKHGVPLKKMKRSAYKDWSELAEFARQFLSEGKDHDIG